MVLDPSPPALLLIFERTQLRFPLLHARRQLIATLHIYMCTCTYMCIYVHMYIFIYASINLYMSIYIIFMWIAIVLMLGRSHLRFPFLRFRRQSIPSLYTYVCACIYVRIYEYISYRHLADAEVQSITLSSHSIWPPIDREPLYICVYICVCVYMYTHTHTHTYIYICK